MATWLVSMVIGCLLRECRCFALVVNPPYQQVAPFERYNFICQANVHLVECQVKNFNYNTVFDLSKGSQFYSGTGLQHGQCGFTDSTNVGVNQFLFFGCRARAHNGSFEYATAVVDVSGSNINGVLPLVTSPRTVLAESGNDVKLTFETGLSVLKCSFHWPGQERWIYRGSTSKYLIDNSNLRGGRCALTLFGVTSDESGIVTSHIWLSSTANKHRDVIHLTTLIVKVAPGAPALSLIKADGVYTEGDVMEASCHVGPARPVAWITWLMNNDVIEGEPEEFSTMPWEFEAGDVTRKLSRKLSLADDGKELVCRVSHVALPGDVVEERTKVTVLRLTVDNNSAWSTWVPTIAGFIGGAVLVAATTGAVIFWLRRKPAALLTGSRYCHQPENPYDELTTVPIVDDPPSAPSAGQSAIYGNTVQYVEVIVGPSAGSKPPPRKPVDPEACVYAEVMHKDWPKN